jgi:hypothetical protein
LNETIDPIPSEYGFVRPIPEKELEFADSIPFWILNEPSPKVQLLSGEVSNQSEYVTVTSVRYELIGPSRLIVGVGVYVGLGVLVAVGVLVLVGVLVAVAVGVYVSVGDGVMVGPNICPGPHAESIMLIKINNAPTMDKCFMFSSNERIPLRVNDQVN